MNLAVQKRHEQLERWRQNEENVELNAKQSQNKAQQVDQATTTNNKNNNANISPSSSIDQNPSILNSTTDTNNNDNDDNNKKQRSSSRRSRTNSENLQVKFTNSTLFLTACANGDLNESNRLLGEQLIDVNVATCDGLTGLHEAAIFGDAQMVEYLLDHGADINCCDNEGWTPLHAASSLGQVKIVEILLERGADVTIVNCENYLAHDLARNDEVKELIGLRLEGLDLDYLHSQEERAIEMDIEKWIKSGQYEERSHPVTNATVLHVIAAKGYLKLMKRILESKQLVKQINLEAEDNEGYTPLLAASFWNQTELVELLIDHGANISAQANNGYKISSTVSILIPLIGILVVVVVIVVVIVIVIVG